MPSKEWLEQHTKVQVYLENDLYQQLEDWMQGNEVQQISQGLTVILQHYLNDAPPKPILSNELIKEVKEQKKELEELKKKFSEMEKLLIQAGAKLMSPKVDSTILAIPTGFVEINTTEQEAVDGLGKGDLCEKIGLTVGQADKAAKDQEYENVNLYLTAITGWVPEEGKKRPRYFPKVKTSS